MHGSLWRLQEQDVSVGEAVHRPRVMSRCCMAPRCFGSSEVRDQVLYICSMLSLYNRDAHYRDINIQQKVMTLVDIPLYRDSILL